MWQQPARPAWVEGVNAFGRATGDPAALVPLDEASLVGAAVRITGLDDFGTDEWRQPFGVLVRSLEQDADLHLVGRLLARNELVRSLRNRLLIVEVERRHPEIAEEAIRAPILVVGSGRSGTSILHELLAQDPAHRVVRTWEALHPVPPPESATYESDPRIALAHQEYATFWNLVTPEYGTMHENGGDVPQEDPLLTMPTFLSDQFMGSYNVPGYSAYLWGSDQQPAFAFHRRTLQLLQWRCPGERWVLKSPSWLSRLPDFFAAYPDGRVIITHRDPLKMLPSLVSLVSTLVWQHSDTVPVAAIAESMSQGLAVTFDRIARMRADGRLPEDRIVDLRFADLMADPWTAMGDLYARLGLVLPVEAERRMREYWAAKPRERLGHRYSFDDTGLDQAATRALYAGYMARHDVTEEV